MNDFILQQNKDVLGRRRQIFSKPDCTQAFAININIPNRIIELFCDEKNLFKLLEAGLFLSDLTWEQFVPT